MKNVSIDSEIYGIRKIEKYLFFCLVPIDGKQFEDCQVSF